MRYNGSRCRLPRRVRHGSRSANPGRAAFARRARTTTTGFQRGSISGSTGGLRVPVRPGSRSPKGGGRDTCRAGEPIQLGRLGPLDTRFTRGLVGVLWHLGGAGTGHWTDPADQLWQDARQEDEAARLRGDQPLPDVSSAKKHSTYDTVRGCFIEGSPCSLVRNLSGKPHSGCGRNPASIVGAFKPVDGSVVMATNNPHTMNMIGSQTGFTLPPHH